MNPTIASATTWSRICTTLCLQITQLFITWKIIILIQGFLAGFRFIFGSRIIHVKICKLNLVISNSQISMTLKANGKMRSWIAKLLVLPTMCTTICHRNSKMNSLTGLWVKMMEISFPWGWGSLLKVRKRKLMQWEWHFTTLWVCKMISVMHLRWWNRILWNWTKCFGTISF